MKTFKSILIIVIILPLTIAILNFTKTEKDTEKEQTKLPDENWEINLGSEASAEQLCFIWNTEAGDSAKLSMDVREDKVIGEFYWLPYEKDSKAGVFKGNISKENENSRIVSGIWEAKAEGTVVKEEIKIILEENIAKVGFGEMKDRGDGVYVYAFPDKISYGPNLQQTDCGDEAMD